ncbi:MAG TPA: class I SAM-dependent methyltransferase [Acidobacteriaceae bacterium]|jgi:methyltransferase (TIGR00027 family)|nr:class I SAM-dependent methyltransferase [Acidobacteriaceae bacterium]
MRQNRRSATAERVAMRRAAHQLYDRPLIFEDPLALRILSDESAERVRTQSEEETHTPWVRGFRAFMAARSRFAEEELAASYTQGIRQYVVLGAGLDTFAYRNPWPDLRVFEVDHPATQAWKRERLLHAGIAIPDSLRFAPVDFEHGTLAAGLDAAGLRTAEPAFFSWLGVVPYLTQEAALATLHSIAGLPGGSGVVFDYCIPREQMSEMTRRFFDALAERVARAGEPFQLFLDPETLSRELRALGFARIEDLDSAAIRARWLGADAQQPSLHGGSGRMVCARLA